MSSRFTGILQVVGASAAFGSMAIFAKLAYQSGLKPEQLLFWRFLLAALALAPWVIAKKLPWPPLKQLVGLMLMGGIGYVGMSACYFHALNYAAAGTVALLLYVYPALVLVLARLFLKEALSPRRLAALVLSVSGLAITVGLAFSGQPLGYVLGIAAAFTYASYIVAGSRIGNGVDPLVSALVVCASAAAVFGVLSAWQGFAAPHGADGWSATLLLALVSTVAAIALFLAGLQKIGAASTSLVSTVEPVVTLLLAASVLGEKLTLAQGLGGALILSAVALIAREADPKRTELTELHE
jgi:drug/metabolite transporter (DMT)-like permease